MEPFETIIRRGGSVAVEEASNFFMKANPVFETLRSITQRLEHLGIPHAVMGGMALVAHGYLRTTEDVDILVSSTSIEVIHKSLVGLGYRPVFEGSKNLRDSQTGVRVEFVIAGQFPGDGKPKPVAFPDPSEASQEIDGIRYLRLPALVELKLASGMTNPGRLKDLADVQELIRLLKLPLSFSGQLHPFVREEFVRLANAIEPTDNTSST